mmetsp:Transcript_128746/g.223285  ORF Transcript_128746/g.223285 Transcript_128746/m.223285 type:complete len:230 (+) Transcript_128746:56-745(+)
MSLKGSKSLSAAELRNDVFWRHQRNMSDSEKRNLEGQWNGRHQIPASRTNSIVNPTFRDYFDRPRDVDYDFPGVRPCVRWRPTWLLTEGYGNKDADLSNLGMRSAPGNVDPTKIGRKRRPQWNERHYVTHSAANQHYHDSRREYFSRHVKPSSQLMLPARPPGLTKALLPYKSHGHEDGIDDEPSVAELILRDTEHLPPMPGPLSKLPPAARAVIVAGRPDASFDSYGE